ncbi:LuxR C-terminal-related transcriptional regulator [Gramella sp. AN32]|uniref:LuxR C-terminal-related transcriptional regulator n=1 Tax=Christiangramia antarctica TaxID=2058158 RepID=A0ABW5X180_9FLAO|nr:LuxR C-terminal-related transcriptional regulator [Gramella sp. AN32]MCM4157206.1 histidine kinase [Gramella sp. AN32]
MHKNIFTQFIASLVLYSLISISGYAQEFVPPIQNFSPAVYNGATQNWDITQADNGFIYSANNQGLLIFDGLSWQLKSLKGNAIIRSVYAFQNKIFTGSFKEFGFWEEDEWGIFNYTSLQSLMADLELRSEEFWEITSIGEIIYFRSFGAIYKYDGKSIARLENSVTTAFERYNDRLLVAGRRDGLYYLNDDGSREALPGNFSILEERNIIDVIEWNDQLVLGTKDRIYLYEAGRIREFPNPELNVLISRFELNHILIISNDELIFGTVKNGVIYYNFKTGKINNYARTSGLQNNTVLGLTYGNGKLWLALDRGIDVIDLKAPLEFYTDDSGELGAVYDVIDFEGNTYIGSNTGIYSFKNGQLSGLNEGKGHTWNLEIINNQLYVNHNTGIFKIKDQELIPIEIRTGSYHIERVPGSSNLLMISHYTGLSVYNSETKEIKEITSITFPIKDFVFENPNKIWAAHPYEGFFEIEFDNDLNVTRLVKEEPLIEGQLNYKPEVYKINNQVIVFISGQWFMYNSFQDKFEKFEEFEKYTNERLIDANNSEYYFVNEEDNSLKIVREGNEIIISDNEFDERLVKSNENIVKANDSTLYVTLNDGFARVDLYRLEQNLKENKISKPVLRTISDNSNYYRRSNNSQITYKDSRNLNLKVGLPFNEKEELTYLLSGEDSISGVVKGGLIELRNLDYGDYSLNVKSSKSETPYKIWSFSILPPWYLSNWMKFLYALIFILGLALIFYFNKIKLKKHQKHLELKFEQEHKERLEKLEKERLMHEIDVKRKELANTTMMAAKKNEVLMEIHNELNKDKVKFSNQFRLKHIMTKINRAVKNKDEWKVFETNFNEVHEDFFKAILEKYPNLTSKDLKLSSYLKMNLSSKEIAPLMGISVRGVEVHRYRLRKKMGLDSKINLTKFLIKNF